MQDQALSTKAFRTNVLSTSQDPTYRICHSSSETTYHWLSACRMLAATEYLKRLNSVASLFHKHNYVNILVLPHMIDYVLNLWLYLKILWDFIIHTDCVISAHQPDIAVMTTQLLMLQFQLIITLLKKRLGRFKIIRILYGCIRI